MTREDPRPLDRVLDVFVGRLRRVDVRLIDEVRERWKEVVDPVLAEHCRAEMIKEGVLIVTVPSGAFAERVREEAPSILAGFASLGARAPTSVATRLERP